MGKKKSREKKIQRKKSKDFSTGSTTSTESEEEIEYKTITYENRNTYEGYVAKNGKRHGYGIYKNQTNHTIYKGNFHNDSCHGFGNKEYVKTGDKYEGNFSNNKRHGYGKYTFSGHNEYVGMFEDGFFHGEGKKRCTSLRSFPSSKLLLRLRRYIHMVLY